MNLCILESSEISSNGEVELKDHRADHILDILRLETGDTCDVGILNGPTGVAEVLAVDDRVVKLRVGELREQPRPQPELILVCALPRPQTLKKVLASAATMGVSALHLIRANRVEKSYFCSPLLEPSNMQSHLIEGLSQGKLTRLPEVHIHQRYRPFFEDYLKSQTFTKDGRELRLVADTDVADSLLGQDIERFDRLIVAIGPEGGWVPFELELMRNMGFQSVSLGRWLLRVESAVVAALAQIELLSSR